MTHSDFECDCPICTDPDPNLCAGCGEVLGNQQCPTPGCDGAVHLCDFCRTGGCGEASFLPESACTRCGYKTDAATMLEDDLAVPAAGDISVCLECAHMTKFGAGLTLVDLTQAELIELATDGEFTERYNRMRSAIEQPEHGGMAS